jgi:hypothetical protein
MRRYVLCVLFLTASATLLTACAATSPASTSNIAGADRDAHGCIGSAGYSWCEYTQRCERPWELAKQKGFTLSQEHVARYCSTGSAE